MNVLWGSFNVAAAWVLLWLVGGFQIHRIADVVAAGVGGLALALLLARAFAGRLVSR